MDPAHQVGRMSVTAPDVTYKEMALHCEALTSGKQKRMSNVMSSHVRLESFPLSQQDRSSEAKKVISFSHVVLQFYAFRSSNRLTIFILSFTCHFGTYTSIFTFVAAVLAKFTFLTPLFQFWHIFPNMKIFNLGL